MIRFWSKVDKRGPAECWPWTGCTRDGYGQLRVDGRTRMATHVSLLLATGEWPTMHVCHTCDNPACVNPDHLFQGTNADNQTDKAAKGRAGKKLDREKVDAIRAARGKLSQNRLAKLFGVSRTTIGLIQRNKTWNHG